MEVITVQPDGSIAIPAAVSERLGIRPGTQLALDRGEDGAAIRLRVLPAEAELVERDGVWVIRSHQGHPEESDVDWVDQVREERDASVLGQR